MKKIFAVTVALAAAASFADSYKWTGAVSSDFADAGNASKSGCMVMIK